MVGDYQSTGNLGDTLILLFLMRSLQFVVLFMPKNAKKTKIPQIHWSSLNLHLFLRNVTYKIVKDNFEGWIVKKRLITCLHLQWVNWCVKTLHNWKKTENRQQLTVTILTAKTLTADGSLKFMLIKLELNPKLNKL